MKSHPNSLPKSWREYQATLQRLDEPKRDWRALVAFVCFVVVAMGAIAAAVMP